LRPVLKVITAWGLKHIDDTQIPQSNPSDADRSTDNAKATEP
jgi:hypothetical protein